MGERKEIRQFFTDVKKQFVKFNDSGLIFYELNIDNLNPHLYDLVYLKAKQREKLKTFSQKSFVEKKKHTR